MDEKLLLEILQNNARISDSDLAKMLKSSDSAVKKKIEELKKKGVIRAFTTYVDWEKKGENFISAYVDIKVTPEARTGFSDLGNELAANDKVEEAAVTSGEYDIRIKIRARDLKDVSTFVTEVLAPKKEVTSTYTHFVLKKFKENGVVISDASKNKKLVISA